MTETLDPPAAAPSDRTIAATMRKRRWAAPAVTSTVALGWLTYSLLALGETLTMEGGLDQTGLTLLAFALSGTVLGAVYAGAVISATLAFATSRKSLGMAGALATGLATGGVAYAYFSADGAVALSLGLVLFGSALVGGLVGLPGHRSSIRAGLTATVTLLLLILTQALIRTRTLSFFKDPFEGYERWAVIAPLVMGLACGITAFAFLRLTRAASRLYGYVLAGALPGGISLLGALFNQIGGEALLAQADEVAPLDLANWTLLTQGQYNSAMTILFAGAITAVLAYGLLLSKDDRRSPSSEG